jgi:hypothetical protein
VPSVHTRHILQLVLNLGHALFGLLFQSDGVAFDQLHLLHHLLHLGVGETVNVHPVGWACLARFARGFLGLAPWSGCLGPIEKHDPQLWSRVERSVEEITAQKKDNQEKQGHNVAIGGLARGGDLVVNYPCRRCVGGVHGGCSESALLFGYTTTLFMFGSTILDAPTAHVKLDRPPQTSPKVSAILQCVR